MKVLRSDKLHGFLTQAKGLLPALQQLADQDSLQQIHPFARPPPAFHPQHYATSSIPPDSQQARINSGCGSLQ